MNVEFWIAASIALATGYLTIVAVVAIVSALRTGGRREESPESHEALSVSRFTIPVSIIVPVTGASRSLSRAISSLLALNYPEFEVIVVTDGAASETFEALTRDWQLQAREFFYRRTLETSPVRRIYRSATDARLMVIDKALGGYGDALNCGVNVSRYRYFMSIAPEVMFDGDALLRVMAAALRDPANVVGASNHVERGADPAESPYASLVDEQAIVPADDVPHADDVGSGFSRIPGLRHIPGRSVVARVAALFQQLASVRSLMESRLAWRHLNAGLGPSGAVVVWRRDAVVKLHGFSSTAADADLDMMFRLQSNGVEGGGRFDRGADVFGRVGPQPLRGALRMASRRQRAALQILWACLTSRARPLELKTLAYFIESELLTPLAQAWIVLATFGGVIAGWFTWTTALLILVMLSFGSAAVSAAALLLRGSAPGAPDASALRRLLAIGPLEFVLYRPALAVARIFAAFTFVKTGSPS